MSRERAFTLSVVTPEGAVLETEATSVVFPAYDGEYGILPNHAPLVALLGIGELRVEQRAGRRPTDRFFVDGGFAQFADNKLSLLTEQARPVADLDAAAAQHLLEEARADARRRPRRDRGAPGRPRARPRAEAPRRPPGLSAARGARGSNRFSRTRAPGRRR